MSWSDYTNMDRISGKEIAKLTCSEDIARFARNFLMQNLDRSGRGIKPDYEALRLLVNVLLVREQLAILDTLLADIQKAPNCRRQQLERQWKGIDDANAYLDAEADRRYSYVCHEYSETHDTHGYHDQIAEIRRVLGKPNLLRALADDSARPATPKSRSRRQGRRYDSRTTPPQSHHPRASSGQYQPEYAEREPVGHSHTTPTYPMRSNHHSSNRSHAGPSLEDATPKVQGHAVPIYSNPSAKVAYNVRMAVPAGKPAAEEVVLLSPRIIVREPSKPSRGHKSSSSRRGFWW